MAWQPGKKRPRVERQLRDDDIIANIARERAPARTRALHANAIRERTRNYFN